MPGQRRPALGDRPPQLPDFLQFGDFLLAVEAYEDRGVWDREAQQFDGAAGTAWLQLHPAQATLAPVDLVALADFSYISQDVEVVEQVVNRQTQISLAAARRVWPDARIGDTLHLETALDRDDLQEVVASEIGLVERTMQPPSKRAILVAFENVSIRTTQ